MDKLEDHTHSTKKTILNVLNLLLICKERNVTYRGESNAQKLGRPTIIGEYSDTANLIARSNENGIGVQDTTDFVNEILEEKSKTDDSIDAVTTSAVRGCIDRMNPVLQRVGRRKPSSTNPTDAWSIASPR